MKTLKEWRLERVLSVRDLAARMHYNRPATITEIESGKRRPRLRTMRTIADALNVEVRDITEFAAELDRKMRTPHSSE